MTEQEPLVDMPVKKTIRLKVIKDLTEWEKKIQNEIASVVWKTICGETGTEFPVLEIVKREVKVAMMSGRVFEEDASITYIESVDEFLKERGIEND